LTLPAQAQQAAKRFSLSRNVVLALIGVTLALHLAEEYFAFPLYAPSLGRDLPSWMPSPALQHDVSKLQIALIVGTVVPCIVIACAIITRIHGFLIASLFVEAILLVNAFAHSFTALLRGGYVPGLVSAILINLPFGIYVFRCAVKEGWIRRYRAWQLIIIAFVVHLVWLGTGVMRAKGTEQEANSSSAAVFVSSLTVPIPR
jgi:hypothetical protein